jgi:hypothetical protein
MRVKPEDMPLPSADQITVASLKAADKKHLLEDFFGDERVQLYVKQLLENRQKKKASSALINADMRNLNNSISFSSNFAETQNDPYLT